MCNFKYFLRQILLFINFFVMQFLLCANFNYHRLIKAALHILQSYTFIMRCAKILMFKNRKHICHYVLK